jgi:hypothetical protein
LQRIVIGDDRFVPLGLRDARKLLRTPAASHNVGVCGQSERPRSHRHRRSIRCGSQSPNLGGEDRSERVVVVAPAELCTSLLAIRHRLMQCDGPKAVMAA